MKYVLILIAALLASYTVYISFLQADQTLLDKTIEYNNWVFSTCFWWMNTDTGTDNQKYRAYKDCWQSQRKLTPDDLFLTLPRKVMDSGQCSISQTEDEHVRPERGGMYATDLACNFEAQGVYAPDYLDQMIEYKIESVWYDNLLGNFVILSFPGDTDWEKHTRWYFGHTVLDEGRKVWDVVTTWVRFAHADISGATTGWHTHIELRRMYDGVWQSVRYVTRSKEWKLEEKRLWQEWNNSIRQESTGSLDAYYFTAYNLGDPNQNDGAPCIGASGKDLCKLEAAWIRTMALTVDIRNKMWIKFGDKVALTGEIGCEWLYQVEDEMNKRFRENCILRPWTNYCIKWDIPSKKGWACQIFKL